ncbi:TonB-dependent receptor [Thalassotalea sp. G2M2-11]|uniref:TonB-dependent receptor n=1 Tax=Thalassotalea sp. G2M2-11 TaxID=2787627 RepID=UPI0019D02022|nr:TonB-dependent receptor [Thalassotalea sp. G2M2-11]
MKSTLAKLSLISTAVFCALQSQVALAQNDGMKQAKKKEKIETIVVTSQKRIERLIDVPISVTNVGKEELAQRGIKKLKDIGDAAPNLTISQGSDFNSKIIIRGVGANSRNIGFDSRVGVYIDGVYLGQSPAINQGLVNLERVEVLRGPQGTLFGKNTIAGAVNLISQEPTDEFEGAVTVNLGNYDIRDYNLQLNIPLSDTTFAKVFLNKAEQEGFIENKMLNTKVGEKDETSGRINLLSELTDKLDLSFSADYTTQDRLAFSNMPLSDPFGGHPTDGMFGDIYQGTAADKYQYFQDKDMDEVKTVWGSSITLDYTFDNDFSVKSITAYRDTEMSIGIDVDHGPLNILNTFYTDAYQQTSQELQLISPDNADFKYILGAYLFGLDSTTVRDANGGSMIGIFGDPRLQPGRPAVAIDGEIETRSHALFANGSYDLNEDIVLGFGVRYSLETKNVDWSIDGSNSGFFNIATGTVIDERTDTNISPSFNINYALSENSQTYARVSTGFKSGGYNLDFITSEVLQEGIEFNEETVTSFEVGYKAELMDYRLRLNTALFYAVYDDYQVNQYIDLGEGRTALSITNAAEVITQGLEVEIDYQITDDFKINGAIGLLDATFDSFPGGGAGGSDASGNELPNAPKVTLGLGLQYYQEVPALSSSIMYRVDYNYTAEQYFMVNNDENYVLPGGDTVDFDKADNFSTVNARISLLSDNGTWEVSFWGQNLTESEHMVNSFRDFFGTILAGYAKPRTFGVETKFNF